MDFTTLVQEFVAGPPERQYVVEPFCIPGLTPQQKVATAGYIHRAYLGISPCFYREEDLAAIANGEREIEDDDRWRWMSYGEMDVTQMPDSLSEFVDRYWEELDSPDNLSVQWILGYENGYYQLSLWRYFKEEGEEGEEGEEDDEEIAEASEEVVSFPVDEEDLSAVISVMMTSERFEDPYFNSYFD